MGNRHKLSKDLINSPPEFSKSTWCQGKNTNRENKEWKRTLSEIQSLVHICSPAFEDTRRVSTNPKINLLPDFLWFSKKINKFNDQFSPNLVSNLQTNIYELFLNDYAVMYGLNPISFLVWEWKHWYSDWDWKHDYFKS